MSSKDSNLSLYNSKYLKYKNKYLSLKKTFGGGNGKEINIILVLPDRETSISIFTQDNLAQQIATHLHLNLLKIKLYYEDNEIDRGLTAYDCGIIEQSRITVKINMDKCTTVEQFRKIAEFIASATEYYNEDGYVGGPKLEYLMNDITFDPISNEIIDINFASTPLYYLPESFGNIKILGSLTLRDIRTFPENFGNLTIGGDLTLINCINLPDSFRRITFNGNLTITNDEYIELPTNFENFEVKGNMVLKIYQLGRLPKNFGSINIGGSLDLRGNGLTQLPITFGNIKIGGNLNLSNNLLRSLPHDFEKIQVGGDLNLRHNLLRNLLDPFKNIIINGILDLRNNKFEEIPKIFIDKKFKEKFKDKYILDDKFMLVE